MKNWKKVIGVASAAAMTADDDAYIRFCSR